MSALAKIHHPGKAEIDAMWVSLRDEVKRSYTIDRALRDIFPITFIGQGDTRQAKCPFHQDKTPSFNISLSRGVYRCFGNGCGEHGDVFKLIMDQRGLGFRDAIVHAAGMAGVTVPDLLRAGRPVGARSARPAPRAAQAAEQIQQIPASLKPHGLIPVARNMRRPVAGRTFRLWQDGGRHGDKDYIDKFYRPAMVHEYRSIDDELLLSVLRLEFNDRKLFIPARLARPEGKCPPFLMEKTPDGEQALAWINEGPGDHARRPVYGMEHVRAWNEAQGAEILVVEGEKTCDAAERLVRTTDPERNWLTLSPMGGGNATIFADWAPLMQTIAASGQRKIRITIWQDADSQMIRTDGTTVDRQAKYVRQCGTSIVQAAIDAGLSLDDISLRHIVPPSGVESGWDIADAEQEGWEPPRLRAYIEKNCLKVDHDMLNIRKIDHAKNLNDTGADDPAQNGPFDEPLMAAPEDDAIWADLAQQGEAGNGDLQDQMNDGIEFDLPIDDVRAVNPASTAASTAATGDKSQIDDTLRLLGIDPDEAAAAMPADEVADDAAGDWQHDGGNDAGGTPEDEPVLANPYFRCLGYRDGSDYFISLTSGQIFGLPPRNYKAEYLLHLAPLEWWADIYGKTDRRGDASGVDWTRASNDLIQNSYAAGMWEPRLQVNQGARLDGKKVVFNTGTRLYVEGREGTCRLWDYEGQYCYTNGPRTRTPAFEAPFEANAPEVKEFLHIIRSLDWRDGSKEISIMALFGWITISPICGILRWRPHLWLDGPRSSGKSWVVNNLVLPALGDYCEQVVSNSSESGIRNLLNGRSIPIVFDEAEGEHKADRERMDAILKLARHSAVHSNSVVAQGVSGGGATRHFSMASTFLMTSIMPQLEAAADKTRFARARLGSGHKSEEFIATIESPAYNLLVEETEIDGTPYRFSDRMTARMIMRAGDYHKVYNLMVEALVTIGSERRVADVYGTFATGAWLALHDGVPEHMADACAFITETFDFSVMVQLGEFNEDLGGDKDHHSVFRELNSQDIRFDSRNSGSRSYQLGDLIGVASGHVDDDDVMIAEDEARGILRRLGIRPGAGEGGEELCEPDQRATHVLIHRKSPSLRAMMENTPYARSFIDVMHQAEHVKIGKKAVRFGATLGGASKPLVVPISYFIATGD